MTVLRSAVQSYVSMRKALGFKLEHAERRLGEFVEYLENSGAPAITTELALAWARRLSGGRPKVILGRLILVRGFARYMQARAPRTEVPPAGLLPPQPRRPPPHLYSNEEIVVLMKAARAWPAAWNACLLETLIGLLASTGMRIGEAIALDNSDIDWLRGLLIIRKGKFGKARQVPLHATTVTALRAYVQRRNLSAPVRN